MTIKTDYSRFDIHDVLTAPEGSAKILEAVARAGEVSKFLGVLAGSPAALRGYARMRHELRGGALPAATRERIGLALAERHGDPYSISQRARSARDAGLGLDEVARARSFGSGDPQEAALLAFVEALVSSEGRPPAHPGEEAREAGWSDEQLIEAVAWTALFELETLLANAAALPQEGTSPRVLPRAA